MIRLHLIVFLWLVNTVVGPCRCVPSGVNEGAVCDGEFSFGEAATACLSAISSIEIETTGEPVCTLDWETLLKYPRVLVFLSRSACRVGQETCAKMKRSGGCIARDILRGVRGPCLPLPPCSEDPPTTPVPTEPGRKVAATSKVKSQKAPSTQPGNLFPASMPFIITANDSISSNVSEAKSDIANVKSGSILSPPTKPHSVRPFATTPSVTSLAVVESTPVRRSTASTELHQLTSKVEDRKARTESSSSPLQPDLLRTDESTAATAASTSYPIHLFNTTNTSIVIDLPLPTDTVLPSRLPTQTKTTIKGPAWLRGQLSSVTIALLAAFGGIVGFIGVLAVGLGLKVLICRRVEGGAGAGSENSSVSSGAEVGVRWSEKRGSRGQPTELLEVRSSVGPAKAWNIWPPAGNTSSEDGERETEMTVRVEKEGGSVEVSARRGSLGRFAELTGGRGGEEDDSSAIVESPPSSDEEISEDVSTDVSEDDQLTLFDQTRLNETVEADPLNDALLAAIEQNRGLGFDTAIFTRGNRVVVLRVPLGGGGGGGVGLGGLGVGGMGLVGGNGGLGGVVGGGGNVGGGQVGNGAMLAIQGAIAAGGELVLARQMEDEPIRAILQLPGGGNVEVEMEVEEAAAIRKNGKIGGKKSFSERQLRVLLEEAQRVLKGESGESLDRSRRRRRK